MHNCNCRQYNLITKQYPDSAIFIQANNEFTLQRINTDQRRYSTVLIFGNS